MLVLTPESAHVWLQSHNIIADANGIPPLEDMDRLLFNVTSGLPQLLPLAHRLANWLEFRQALLWMDYWGSPEPEVMDAFLQIRKRHHFNEKLMDAPAFLFDNHPDDRQTLGEVMFYMLLLNWEGFLYCDEPKSLIWLADEIVDIRGALLEHEEKLLEIFVSQGFLPVGE